MPPGKKFPVNLRHGVSASTSSASSHCDNSNDSGLGFDGNADAVAQQQHQQLGGATIAGAQNGLDSTATSAATTSGNGQAPSCTNSTVPQQQQQQQQLRPNEQQQLQQEQQLQQPNNHPIIYHSAPSTRHHIMQASPR